MLSTKNIKRTAVALGVFLGATASFLVVPSRQASASILVFDQANVAKTIEIVTNTVTMITKMAEEIQLLQKAIQNMDAQAALSILKTLDSQQAALTKGHEALTGLGKKDIETVGLWQQRIGVAQDIASGKTGPVEAMEQIGRHHELIYDTTTDAAKTAKTAQTATEQISQNLKVITEASNNAEGTKAAVQANTAIIVQNTQAVMQNTELLSQLVQMEAAKQGTEEAQNALSEQLGNAFITSAANAYKESGSN